MREEDIELLEKYDWIVVCESPFELESWEDDICVGTATGWGAELILEIIKKKEKNKKK